MILYVVPMPIGNIKDITYRAIEVIRESDIILCEDTRFTLKVLNYYGIKKKLVAYHKFNEYKMLDNIINNILSGRKYVLVSDAGMPGISDPGKILINKCIDEQIKVDVLPGACALINGFVLSGFKNDIFTFIGFLPRNAKKSKDLLDSIRGTGNIIIIYEAPHRLLLTLNFLKQEFGGNQNIYLGRELTKIFEENFRGTIDESINYFSNLNIRGEFVICIENLKREDKILSDKEIINKFFENKNKYNLTNKENISKICKENNIRKNYIYDLIHKLDKL